MMFPNIVIPDINSDQENTRRLGKVFKFDFEKNEYVIQNGKLVEISNEEAVKQFTTWTLKTQVAKFNVYPKDYGIDKDSFIGFKKLPQGFINSELKRQIEEQLIKHPLILGVTDFSYKKSDSKLIVDFTIVTTFNENLIYRGVM